MWPAAAAFPNLVLHQGQRVGALCIVSCLGRRQAEGTVLAPPTMIYRQELIKEEFHLIKKLVIKKEPTSMAEQQTADEHSPENCCQGTDEKCAVSHAYVEQ